MPTPPQHSLRRAERKDRPLLARFLNSPAYSHRHLDWREPLDWLGSNPFWILERNFEVEAVLACPPDPPDVAWVRLFAVAPHTSPSWTWGVLHERAVKELSEINPQATLVSLGLQDWFSDLLSLNHFEHHQDIIVLAFEGAVPAQPPASPGAYLRLMRPSDLETVTQVDNLAFEPIWRLSADDLRRAYDRSTYKTVVELDGEVIGYQMSALNGFNAHLARLAVHPQAQRRRIGYWLVQNVIQHFIGEHGSWGVTLNTQDTNQASLALYQKVGFRLTGERFPVYVQPPIK